MAVKATYEPSLQSHTCIVVGKHALFKLNIDCSDAKIRIRHHIGPEGDCQERSWREPWRESDEAHELCQSAWATIQADLYCHTRLSYKPAQDMCIGIRMNLFTARDLIVPELSPDSCPSRTGRKLLLPLQGDRMYVELQQT